MEVKIFVNNPFQENTILLYDETGEAVVIDCGCVNQQEEERFKNFIEENKLNLVGLLNTHLHPDHVFGNGFIKDTYGLGAQASQEDEFLLLHTVEYAAMLGLQGMEQPPALGKYLKDGDKVKFGNTVLEVMAIGGHSPGGLCFYNAEDKILIAGDVLFEGSVGRSDLPGGDAHKLIKDIKEKLFILPEEVKVYPGHGNSTTIGREKRYNPFFN